MEKNNKQSLLPILVTGLIVLAAGTYTITEAKKTMSKTVQNKAQQPTSIVPIPSISDMPNAPIIENDKTIESPKLLPEVPQTLKSETSVKKIKSVSLNMQRTLRVTGRIGDNAHQAAVAIRLLNNISKKEPIYLILSSPGGSVIDGAALISAMQVSEAPVYTICYSFCASMAAMIHQYGTKRYVTDRSILMFHPASFQTGGEVDKVFSEVSTLKRYINKIELEVAARMKMSLDKYKQLTSVEYWIDSEDSLAANATDAIVYMTYPGSLMNLFNEPEDQVKQKQVTRNRMENFQWIYQQ